LDTDYWFNDKMPIEEIITITGLSKYEIEETIQRRTIADNIKKMKIELKNSTKMARASPPPQPQSNEIADLRKELIELKKSMMEMLQLIKTLTQTNYRHVKGYDLH
jgi:Mg2+ and Co2+ transporter CorA